ncbi:MULTISPECIES: DUF21 domain-containing protein [unclassified Colwellia]|uniref:DUF21 domain-containing protein n=1 Tax=unclassified Colwellia TaxID=196834 RepID=UPI0015F3FB79|nr:MULTISPECIES: CNNM domain-containing protein [unclassified Colwellia]MBA6350968.1 DUF21 domain-containing protein [Colwellia sp. BRX9-1]MBA6356933.1 DUF21 domain-containing protein [Colwellia sp. BRX8-3]MBA6360829.1 DUF21 domain-containing protein [Colwellia sp. BRX8-6]MBA6368964.1 DUF21 domain-containing protein [Colwellia sp. BRX8-5]MBA6374818.1 DUF21 domain-containing protein [Colwellia sp. BRX8-2]
MTYDIIIWLGIGFCITQSAIFSGLNLAFFSLSRLQLEVEAKQGNKNAIIILSMREDSNFLLSTVLWGNVSINVLLTLLSGSVLAGIYSFLFSTIVITFLGEIIPQAYFSRNALQVASKLTPVIKVYQILLFPVAKLTALILDGWLGKEGITYYREKQLAAIIKAHIDSDDSDMEHVQGRGALNFLQVENITVFEEGELLDPASIISMPSKLDFPILPAYGSAEFKDFISVVNNSGHKWVLIQSEAGVPLLLLDADGFVRATTQENNPIDPYEFCHRPVIIRDPKCTLGEAMNKLKSVHDAEPTSDDVLHTDAIIVWTDLPHRIITGADILGRLLKGIGQAQNISVKVTPPTSP